MRLLYLALILPTFAFGQNATSPEIAVSQAMIVDCSVNSVCVSGSECEPSDEEFSILFTILAAEEFQGVEAVYWLPSQPFSYAPAAHAEPENFSLDDWLNGEWEAPFSGTNRVVIKVNIETGDDLHVYEKVAGQGQYSLKKLNCEVRDPL